MFLSAVLAGKLRHVRAPALFTSCMSIAVCALIRPSRLLRRIVAAYAAACGCAAIALAWGAAQAPAWPLPAACAALCALAALAAWGAAPATTRRIDISGPGAIRLLVQHSMGAPVLELLPMCTVWPWLIVLLLREAGQGVTALLILPDSVPPEQFRNIAVAIRTIAGRDEQFKNHKIF